MNSTTSTNTVPYLVPNVEWALAYARAGFWVLPLSADRPHVCLGQGCKVGKEPNFQLVKRGYLDATRDEATIRALWQQCPDANIGIACFQSGIIALDLDRHNPEANGIEQFQAFWTSKGGSWPPPAPIQRTAGSGLHVIFKRPAFDLKASSLGLKGVDVKDRGYIVVEPSTRKHCIGTVQGGQYWWVRAPGQGTDYSLPGVTGHGTPIAELPGFLQLQAFTTSGDQRLAPSHELSEDDRKLVIAALEHIPADEYQTWLNIGMALKACGFELGVWDEWSRKSSKYSESACSDKWQSFRRQGIKQGTIFLHAKQHGFKFPEGHFRLNDIGNAQRLVANYGHLIRWYSAEKRWRVWDGMRWGTDDTERVLAFAKETVQQIFKEGNNG